MSKYQEEHEDVVAEFISPLTRIIFTTAAGLISLFCFVLIARYLVEHKPPTYPKDIASLMAYCVSFIVFINIPWGQLFHKIKKIGPVEFQHVFESQIKEIADLEDRLSALENNVDNGENYNDFIDSFYEKDLMGKLSDFLYEHRPTAFSPIRIKEWGGKQNGYEIFSNHDVTMIRRFLRKLLSEDKVTTAISKKGNILYRISDE